MRAYSQDLRERILRAVDLGHSRAEIVQLFGISRDHQAVSLHNDEKKGRCDPKRFLVVPPREAGTGGGQRKAPITGA